MTTPEARVYQESRDAVAQANQKLWRRIAAALGLALLISVGSNVYNATLTNMIRATQVGNTKTNQCEVKTFDAILKDARLAFAGDKNAADYAKAPKEC